MTDLAEHPTYGALRHAALGGRDDVTRAHLATCAVCRSLLQPLVDEPLEASDAAWLAERPVTLPSAAIDQLGAELAAFDPSRRVADATTTHGVRPPPPIVVRPGRAETSWRRFAAPAGLAAAALLAVVVQRASRDGESPDAFAGKSPGAPSGTAAPSLPAPTAASAPRAGPPPTPGAASSGAPAGTRRAGPPSDGATAAAPPVPSGRLRSATSAAGAASPESAPTACDVPLATVAVVLPDSGRLSPAPPRAVIEAALRLGGCLDVAFVSDPAARVAGAPPEPTAAAGSGRTALLLRFDVATVRGVGAGGLWVGPLRSSRMTGTIFVTRADDAEVLALVEVDSASGPPITPRTLGPHAANDGGVSGYLGTAQGQALAQALLLTRARVDAALRARAAAARRVPPPDGAAPR